MGGGNRTRRRKKVNRPTIGAGLRSAVTSGIGSAATGLAPDNAYAEAAMRWDEAAKAAAKATPAAEGLDGLDADFSGRLSRFLAESPGITVSSGFRSNEEQQRLWNANPNPRMVARPGHSNHEKGVAADLHYPNDQALAWAHQNAARFGLNFPMDWENWHIEPAGVRTDPATPKEAYTDPGTKDKPRSARESMAFMVKAMEEQLASVGQPAEEEEGAPEQPQTPEQQLQPPTGPTPEGEYAGIAGVAGQEQTVARPSNVLESSVQGPAPEPEPAAPAAPAGGGETGEGGDAESWIREAMRITGVDESWYPGLKARMMQESGGRNIPQGIVDINTQKGTPAFGPMQVIEPTFRSNAMPGYENWKDPLHNTIAAIRYIQNRYGHPSKLPRGGY